MCRYGEHTYKQKYACFACRKMFRRPVAGRSAVCPECGLAMSMMGRDFKAPRQADVRQWRKVELLVRRGYAFDSCGCFGPGARPATLREVPAFLEEQERAKGEWARRQTAQQRARNLASERKKRREAMARKRLEKSFREQERT